MGANIDFPEEFLAVGFQMMRFLAVIEGLPDDIVIEPAYHIVQLGGQRFSASEFFDHFHDDHEPGVRAWLARVEKQ